MNIPTWNSPKQKIMPLENYFSFVTPKFNFFDVKNVINFIISNTQYNFEEIEKMILDIIKKMDGMVNEDGAAFVVLHNLGLDISLYRQQMNN